MKKLNKRGLILAACAATLLSSGFLSSVNAAESNTDKFSGMKVANSCGKSSCNGKPKDDNNDDR